MTTTIRDLLRHAHQQTRMVGSCHQMETQVLLSHVLAKPRSYLLAWPQATVSAARAARFQTLLARCIHGEPLAYIVGRREFWSLPLVVTRDTLIPRPESELLVEKALERIQSVASPLIADLGTGSGAIALAIAHDRPDARIIATDKSAAALAIAQENATTLGLSTIQWRHGSWLTPVRNMTFDLIVSNPPYVAATDPHLRALAFEPPHALISGPSGLDDIALIANTARAQLVTGGGLLLEHGHDQKAAVEAILHNSNYAHIEDYRDYSGNDRVIFGCAT